MVNKYYQKHKERSKKKQVKDIKIFLKKKKRKDEKKVRDRYNNLPQEQKRKLIEYMRNIV